MVPGVMRRELESVNRSFLSIFWNSRLSMEELKSLGQLSFLNYNCSSYWGPDSLSNMSYLTYGTKPPMSDILTFAQMPLSTHMDWPTIRNRSWIFSKLILLEILQFQNRSFATLHSLLLKTWQFYLWKHYVYGLVSTLTRVLSCKFNEYQSHLLQADTTCDSET